MTDELERMDAGQKEGSKRATNEAIDTEFAADTWMGAVLNPDAVTRRDDGTTGVDTATTGPNAGTMNRFIEYDPDTYTERYRGERSNVSVDSPDPAGTGTATRLVDDDPRPAAGLDADRLTRYELAEETAAPPRPFRVDNGTGQRGGDARDEHIATGSGMGMIALGMSILSLFLLPYLLGPIGIVLGYLAYRREARTLGLWAMGLGALAVLGAVMIYPFIVT